VEDSRDVPPGHPPPRRAGASLTILCCPITSHPRSPHDGHGVASRALSSIRSWATDGGAITSAPSKPAAAVQR
jgi:hypothetical protein